MINHLSFQISGSGFFCCVKEAKMNFLHANTYGCLPFGFLFTPVNTTKSTGIVCSDKFLVLTILRVIAFSEILKSIVRFATIFMVDLIVRPRTSYMQPSKAMRSIRCTINFYNSIAFAIYSSGNITGSIWARFSNDRPCENSSARIIIQNLAQVFCCKLWFSHDALLSLIGQRPARVHSALGSRHYIRRSA